MGMIRDAIFVIVLLLVVVVLTIKFSPNPTGYTVFEKDVSYFVQENNLEHSKDLYNENVEYVPSFIKTIISNEKVNVVLDDNNDGLKKFSFETKKGKIETISSEPYEKPSLIVYSDIDTLQEIKESEKIMSAIEEALDDEKIHYESIDWSTKVKTGLANIFINIWSVFD